MTGTRMRELSRRAMGGEIKQDLTTAARICMSEYDVSSSLQSEVKEAVVVLKVEHVTKISQ
jgi:hypothetical protein